MKIILILLLSFIPALFFIFTFFMNLKFNTITIKKGLVFLFMGCLSVGLTLTFYKHAPSILTKSPIYSDRFFYLIHKWFINVALIEETIKVIIFMLAYKLIDPRTINKKGVMIYMGLTALGFASIENAIYAINSINSYTVLFIRSFTSTIGHLIFGLVSGYYIANIKIKRNVKIESIFDALDKKHSNITNTLNLITGILLATLFHGIYNLNVDVNGGSYQYLSNLFFILLVGGLTARTLYKSLK